jgi:glucokinase
MGYVAVDLGGSHISYGITENGALIDSADFSISDATYLAPELPRLKIKLEQMIAGWGRPLEGIGLGFCGIVDERANRVVSTNGKYIDAPQIDFSEWARSSFGLPILLANDARMALRGEMLAGAARDELNVVMITLGTGIGGVAAVDGRLPNGAHGFAASLGGHMPVALTGRRCTCGGLGCAESEASGWALPALCREQPDFCDSKLAMADLNFRNLFECAAEGDAVALRIRDHCLHVWALATVSAVLSYDPSMVVFGGGVMQAADIVLPSIRRYVERNAWTPHGAPRLVMAQLGNQAALLGVERLFREKPQADV